MQKQNFKVLILGDSGVGKTSISLWFKKYNDIQNNKINFKENEVKGIVPPKATVAPDMIELTYILNQQNNIFKKIRLTVWDTVGHEIHDDNCNKTTNDNARTTITKLLLRDADVIIFCFDVNDNLNQSLNNILLKWKNLIYRPPIKKHWRRIKADSENYENLIIDNDEEESKQYDDNDDDDDDEIKKRQVDVNPNCLFYLVGNKIDLSDEFQNIISSNIIQPTIFENSNNNDVSNLIEIEEKKSNFSLTLNIDNNNSNIINQNSIKQKRIIPNYKLLFKKSNMIYYNDLSQSLDFNYVIQSINVNNIVNSSTMMNTSPFLSSLKKEKGRPRRSISVSNTQHIQNQYSPTLTINHSTNYSDFINTAKQLLSLGHDHNEIFFISSNPNIKKSFGIQHLFEFICVDLINYTSNNNYLNNKQKSLSIVENNEKLVSKVKDKNNTINKQNCCFYV